MSAPQNKEVVKTEKKMELTTTYDVAKPAEAVKMAVVLKNIVVSQNLYTHIQGRNYAHVEGWMLAGMLTGINVIVDEPKDISKAGEIKYSASATLYQGDKIVGKGFAVCSNKESKKVKFDEYAILSMAQTRAIGKAYRNKIGFIMKLAGFQGTPAEEMKKVGDEPNSETIIESGDTQEIKKGQVIGPDGNPTWVCSKTGDPITEAEYAYSVKVFGKALSREAQKTAKKK